MTADLFTGIAELGLEIDSEQAAAFARYLAELRLWNPRLGLVEADDHGLVTHHLLDCAAAHAVFRTVFSVLDPGRRTAAADLGSGAGLPGIPLSILFPDIDWHLIEKQGRRCAFLENCRAMIAATRSDPGPAAGVSASAESVAAAGQVRRAGAFAVHHRSVRDLEPGSFDLVTNRAFSPLTPDSLADQARLLRRPGFLVLYKGKRESLAREARDCGLGIEFADDAELARVLLNPGEAGANRSGGAASAGEPAVPRTMYAVRLAVPGLDAQRYAVVIPIR